MDDDAFEIISVGSARPKQQQQQDQPAGPPRRKKVSYEVFDDEDADGGPTPAPSRSAQRQQLRHQQQAREQQRRESPAKRQKIVHEVDEDDDIIEVYDAEHEDEEHWRSHKGKERRRQQDHGRNDQRRTQRQNDDQSASRSSHEQGRRPGQCLPTETEEGDASPTSDSVLAYEYLALVQKEAQRAPLITRAHNPYELRQPTAAEREQKEAQKANAPSALPDKLWRKHYLDRFRSVRDVFRSEAAPLQNAPKDASGASGSSSKSSDETINLPDLKDRAAWFSLVHRRPAPRGILWHRNSADPNNAADEDDFEYFKINDFIQAGRMPSPTLLRRFSQRQILALIQLVSDIIPRFSSVAQNADFNSPYTVSRDVINSLHAKWLFALLVMLDSQLTSDQLNELRNTARTIVFNITLDRFLLQNDLRELTQLKHLHDQQRSKGENSPAGADGSEWSEYWHAENDEMYRLSNSENHRMCRESSAWILVTIIAGFWAQYDLLDEAEESVKKAGPM